MTSSTIDNTSSHQWSSGEQEPEPVALFRLTHDALPIAFAALRIVRDLHSNPIDLEWMYQNAAASRMNRLPAEDGCRGHRLLEVFPRMRESEVWSACVRVAQDGSTWQGELDYTGEHFDSVFRVSISRPVANVLVLAFEDVTEVRREARRREEDAYTNEVLLRVANALTDLDLESVVQKVTDEGRKVCRAEFGAFFYNVKDARGESYMLYTVSGVHRRMFENFPMPRNTEIFAPTFSGTRVVRSDDITRDPSYGKNPPFYGMPKGHLPVHSYLAVPVVARSGEVLGGLFFGHHETGRFTDRDERIIVAIAHQAAAAMDNARLFEIAARERERAEEANRAKDEFLATVSHELRTPLQAMLGWARMLKSGMLVESKRHRAIEAIERNAKSQVALIDDVLDVSRIITGKLRLHIESVDLTQVVDAALDSVRPAAEARDVRLQVVLDPDAGPTLGDANRLQQVVWNLLSNAVKFTPKGGRVLVRVQRESSHVKIIVSDTGQGIAAEFLPFVFDRFRQGDSKITRAHGGLGLGLAIVKHLTELHGGMVSVESPGLDQGATFIVK
ncbi:MAG TPA: GAF domain-containing sensor histidine kinase, partial [Polyangiaceae bacterium]